MKYKTPQEDFWAGDFGDNYTTRNHDPRIIANRTAVFSKILSRAISVNSIIEFGANIGQNIIALKQLLPEVRMSAIEINEKAIETLSQIPNLKVFHGSILDYSADGLGKYDLVFTAGVLIHICPEQLNLVYTKLHECSNKYILIKEYYNPKPVELEYRGNTKRLYKRDFAGEILDHFPDLELIDYGFQYHRDNLFPLDDISWFLLKKNNF